MGSVRIDLEPEPVEPRTAFVRVVEIIDVVGRAVDVAAEDKRVGVPPVVVRLGLDRRGVGGVDREPGPVEEDRKLWGSIVHADRDLSVAGLRRPVRKVRIGVARMEGLDQAIAAGTIQRDGCPVGRPRRPAPQGHQKPIGATGLDREFPFDALARLHDDIPGVDLSDHRERQKNRQKSVGKLHPRRSREGEAEVVP